MDLALSNQQRLICHKNPPDQPRFLLKWRFLPYCRDAINVFYNLLQLHCFVKKRHSLSLSIYIYIYIYICIYCYVKECPDTDSWLEHVFNNLVLLIITVIQVHIPGDSTVSGTNGFINFRLRSRATGGEKHNS